MFTCRKKGSIFDDLPDIAFITCVDPDSIPEVPVPAAIWLFGTALIGFIGLSRRRKVPWYLKSKIVWNPATRRVSICLLSVSKNHLLPFGNLSVKNTMNWLRMGLLFPSHHFLRYRGNSRVANTTTTKHPSGYALLLLRWRCRSSTMLPFHY